MGRRVSSAQESPAPPAPASATSSRLRVYIESCNCFGDFLRTEIRWVDFVRQQQDADLQILSRTTATGAGGVETVLRFVGSGRFNTIDHELRATTPPGEPEDVRRRDVLRTVQVGLLGFVARDGIPSDLRVNITAPRAAAETPQRDPWNFWVFRVSGQGSYEDEETNRQKAWEFGVSADRITNNWLLSFSTELDTQTEEFNLDEEDIEDDPLKVVRRERRADWFVAKSLGRHLSFGVDGDLESSTFGNVKFATEALPALEFNVFPYEQYASRQLRIMYGIGVQHARYNEVTLFGKLRETRPRHEVSVTLDQREPWGTLQSSVQWSQYLHDTSRNRLEFEAEIGLRLLRGLSLEIEGQASRIRDQLSLPRRGATPEEVLLRVRELQSGHEVGISVGLAYSFGSIFNNVVNPRFGRD
jgi:hypothetical protein